MLFRYIVRFYVEDLEEVKNLGIYPNITETGLVTEKGVVAKSSYGEAVEEVVDFVGRDNVVSVEVWELENPLCDEEIKDMLEE